MTDNANDILMGSGAPSVKFPTVGTVITGTVVREPTSSQQTNFRTKVPEFWKDGSPKMQVIVQLQTNMRDPQQPEDDGTRSLYIKGKELTNAIRQAVRASGANGIHAGGTLTVAYIGDGPAPEGLDEGPKLYSAQYQPPAVSFSGVTAPTPAPQPVYAQPVAQPAYAQTAMVPAAPAYAPPQAPAVQPTAAQSVVPNAPMPCPPNVDPATWAVLTPAQRDAVLAATAVPAQQPGF